MVYRLKYLNRIFLVLGLCAALFTRCAKDESITDPDEQPVDVIIKPNDFLAETTYHKLTVEIAYVQGYEPTSTAINNLKIFLENVLNKSGGISVTTSEIASPGKSAFSLSNIKEIEKTYRTRFPEENDLAAWFFVTDADYADNEANSKVLGIAYGSTSMAIFGKTIREFSGGLGKPSTGVMEETVMKHEFGHILGLVNNGTEMVENHQDTDHERHCDNEDCLMYYAAEHSSGIINFLSGGGVPALDTRCRADLKNNGGK